MSDSPNPGNQPLPPPQIPPTGFQPPQVGDAAGQMAGHVAGHVAGSSAEPTMVQHTADAVANASRSNGAQVAGRGSEIGRTAGDSAHRSADSLQSAHRSADGLQSAHRSADSIQSAGHHGVADAARTQGSIPRTGRRLRRLRHLRPRASVGFIGGAAAAVAVAAGGIAIAARDDGGQQRVQAATTIEAAPVAPVVTTNAPPVKPTPTVRVPVPVTDAPTTVAETTTTVEPTTTVAALPSGAGTYAVASGDIVVSGAVINGSIGNAGSQTWVLSGACDGVADCTITTEGVSVASTAAASPLPGGGTVELTPAGPGAYAIVVSIPLAECGDGSGSMTISLTDGAFNGEWVVTFSGGASCPFTTLSVTYSGTRV